MKLVSNESFVTKKGHRYHILDVINISSRFTTPVEKNCFSAAPTCIASNIWTRKNRTHTYILHNIWGKFHLFFIIINMSTINVPVTSLHNIRTNKTSMILWKMKLTTFNCRKIKSLNTYKIRTLTAAMTALPTSPGGAFHVPRPTEGILAPVLSSKYTGPCWAFSLIFFHSDDQNYDDIQHNGKGSCYYNAGNSQ